MSALRWLASYDEEGDVVFRIGRDGDELVAEWIGVARLTASRDGTSSRLEVVPGAPARSVKKIEEGSLRLLLRHAAGRMAFHGSAIEVAGRAHVLLGRSGQGKSTLAAWLCAHGATLFADDAVAIDTGLAPHDPPWLVTAGEREHWLDEEARLALGWNVEDAEGGRGKLPVRSLRLGHGSVPLGAFVELVFADAAVPRMVRLGGVDALAVLVPQVVRFVLDEPARYRSELDELAELLDCVPVYRLERPRDIAHLGYSGVLVQRLARQP